MRPALIVLDIQNIWLDKCPEMKKGIDSRAKDINEAIAWFRKRGLPVIVVYHEDRQAGAVPGTKAFEFYEKINVSKNDTTIVKRHPNAFGETGLEGVLRQLGCDSIVITGVSAVWCAMGTFFGAMDWNIDPYVLKGGVAADKEEYVRFAEEICEAWPLEKIAQKLK